MTLALLQCSASLPRGNLFLKERILLATKAVLNVYLVSFSLERESGFLSRLDLTCFAVALQQMQSTMQLAMASVELMRGALSTGTCCPI